MAYNQDVDFQWDERKNRANKVKHGFSFEEVQELFESGTDYLEIFDSAHSFDEDRFIAIGPIRRGIVAVVWVEVELNTVRIISARRATAREIKAFRDQCGGS